MKIFNFKQYFNTISLKMDISGMRREYGNKRTLFLEKDIKHKEPISLFEEWFRLVKENPRTVEANAMCVSTANKNGIPSARYCLLKGYSKEGFIFFTHYTSRKGKELEENPYAALTFYWDQYNRSHLAVTGVRSSSLRSTTSRKGVKLEDTTDLKETTQEVSIPCGNRLNFDYQEDRREAAEALLPLIYLRRGEEVDAGHSHKEVHVQVRIEGRVEKLPFSQADEYFTKRPYGSQIGALCSDQSKPVESREILEKRANELETKYQEGEVPRPAQWGGYIVKPTSFEFWQGQTDRIHDRIVFRKPTENEPDGTLTHQAADGWIYERLNP